MPFTGIHLRTFEYFALLTCLLPLCFGLPLPAPQTLQCLAVDWRGILLFFLLNYATHTATVPSMPGAPWWANLQWQVFALLLPFAGLGRAVGLLGNHCACGGDALGKAMAVGAVAVVGRSQSWEPHAEGEAAGE
jgi:hypothetical protein